MSSRKIEVELKTKADTKPLTNYGKSLNILSGSIRGIGGVVARTAEKFGEFGGIVGSTIKNVLQGGIWGIMGTLVSEVWGRWSAANKEAEEAARKEAEETSRLAVEYTKREVEERSKMLRRFEAAAENAAKARRQALEDNIKAIRSEVDATRDLVKAQLELEKARAARAGNVAEVARLEGEIAGADIKSAADKFEEERKYLETKIANAKKDFLRNLNVARVADKDETAARSNIEESVRGSRERALVLARSKGLNRRQQRAAANIAEQRYRETSDYKEELELAENASNRAAAARTAANEASRTIRAAKVDLDVLDKRSAALELKAQTEALNRESAAAEKAVAEAKERERAEIAAAQEAARERERLDRELHQKRMADIRSEIEAQKSAANPLRAVAAAASGEFEYALAMFRDPSRAAAVVNEEKDRQSAIDRLHRRAAGYSHNWQISELSGLMAAGDTEGVQARLNSWRKFRSFSPEIEAMVRASAAERTKTSAEESLRNIETNTKGLSDKLDELLKMK